MSSASGQVITTIAGNGTYGYSGDGGPATLAQMAWPLGIALDNAGNIYIADHSNNVIRKVSSAGIITTVIGTGVLGYSGDGGPAIAAKLYHPSFVNVDPLGNIYFADQNGDVIRKVNTAGIITTIGGAIATGYSGDGGPLSAAVFAGISGISFDNVGNMYIADAGNHVIRKVNSAGIISTIVGNGTPGFSGDGGLASNAQLNGLYAVAFDNFGNMYIPDDGNNRIRKVNTAGIISTFAGNGILANTGDGGPATAASIKYPWTVAVDNANNVYIGDADHVVRKVNSAGIISSFAGNGTYGYTGDGGPAANALLGEVAGIRVDNLGNVYILIRDYFEVLRKVSNCLVATINQQPSNISLCNSGSTFFSVNATGATGYQWQLNTGTGWANISNNGTYSGSTSNLLSVGANVSMNGYQYRCAIANACATGYSAIASLTVTAAVTPSISVVASNNNICAGNTVVFTATAANGGTTPLYQWKKNGINVGTNLSTYTDAGLVQGDNVTCILTSNAPCAITPTATSNTVSVTVMPLVVPTVTITTNNAVICSQANALFTVSTLINGGTNPQFQWKVNGINSGSNTNTFNTTTLNNSDIVTLTITSNSTACLSVSSAVSNAITISVQPLYTPTVSIAASSIQICSGIPITFTATSANGGTSPGYQWKVNNQNAGTGNNVFTTSSLQNGDVVSCMMTSNSTACLSATSAVSNNITVTQKPAPSVSVVANTNAICTGSSVQFTATAVDAGATVNYEWYVNNTLKANTTSPVYTDNSLLNNDNVSCKMITNNGCNYTIASNIIPISVDNPAIINFLPDTVIDNGIGVQLNPLISGFAVNSYQWSPIIDLDFSNIKNPTVRLSSSGRAYKLTVTTKNGCSSDAQITVKIIDVKIPNAFSPNGDGLHENWDIIGLTANCSVEVFDRNGIIVFHSIGYTAPWDGTCKNKPVPVGTYYYLIDLKDSNKKYSGWVVILR